MKKTLKITTSVFLTLTMLFVGCFSMAISAVTDLTVVRDTASYDDEEFPVDFYITATPAQLNVDSVLDIPQELVLNIDLKENFPDGACTVAYFGQAISYSENADTKNAALMSDVSLTSKKTVTIDFNTEYNFDIKISLMSGTFSYMGTLFYSYDMYDGGILYLDVEYESYVDHTAMARNTTYVTETESNNSTSNPNMIENLVPRTGIISSNSDVDYYKFIFDSDFFSNHLDTQLVYGGVKIRLTVPDEDIYDEDFDYYESVDLEMQIYDADLNLVQSCTVGGNVDEYCTFYYTAGETYYIKIYAYSTVLPTSNYVLSLSLYPMYTWYSQFTGTDNQGDFLWDTHNLNNWLIYNFSNANANRLPFIIDGQTDDTHMSGGCAIASFAMVLRNQNLTMTGKDIRTGFTGALNADPYSVTLANMNIDGTGLSFTNGQCLTNYSGDPVAISTTKLGYIATKFSTVITKVDSTTLSSYKSSETEFISSISGLLSINPYGIIIQFIDADETAYGSHFIVFTQVNSSYTGSEFNEKFYVCDSGTSRNDKGNNVLFSKCTSKNKYSWDEAVNIYLVGYQEGYE